MNLADPAVQVIVGAIISVPVGIISGIYSGVIVTRMARFAELRNAIKRTILNIDFIDDDQGVHIIARKEISEIDFAASDLFYLRHTRAGDIASRLGSEIARAIASAPKNISMSQIEKEYSEWQQECRQMKPNRRVIFSFTNPL